MNYSKIVELKTWFGVLLLRKTSLLMARFFSLDELTRSATADRLGIDNTPDTSALVALEALICNVLDPVRELWGSPVFVNSGFRCPALNRAVGGAASSQHLRGEAADITAGSVGENRRLFELVAGAGSGIPFDQLIDERGYTWIHISFRAGKDGAGRDVNRHQILHL